MADLRATRIITTVSKPSGREAYVVALVHNDFGWLPELQTASINPDGTLASPKARQGIRTDCLDAVIRGFIEARTALHSDGGDK